MTHAEHEGFFQEGIKLEYEAQPERMARLGPTKVMDEVLSHPGGKATTKHRQHRKWMEDNRAACERFIAGVLGYN